MRPDRTGRLEVARDAAAGLVTAGSRLGRAARPDAEVGDAGNTDRIPCGVREDAG